MELKERNGQAFILGAVIFTSIFLVAITPAGPEIRQGSSASIQSFFQQAQKTESKAFNDALQQNKSLENIRNSMYVYNKYLEQSLGRKGGSLELHQFIILPEEGDAVFINFRSEKTDVDVLIDSWNNKSDGEDHVEPNQWREYSFSPGERNITIRVNETDQNAELRGFKPRLMSWMRMERENQRLETNYTG